MAKTGSPPAPRPKSAEKPPEGSAQTAAKRPAAQGKRPNCGSGAGGFKPGNVCGHRNRQAHAAKLRAARHAAREQGEHADHEVRRIAAELRTHRRDHEGAIANNAARWHLDALKAIGEGRATAGTKPKPQPMPKPAPVAEPKPAPKSRPTRTTHRHGPLDIESDSSVAAHVQAARAAIAKATAAVPGQGAIAERIAAHAGGEAARRAIIEADDYYAGKIAGLRGDLTKGLKRFQAIDRKIAKISREYVKRNAAGESTRSPGLVDLHGQVHRLVVDWDSLRDQLRDGAKEVDRLNARRVAHLHNITAMADGMAIRSDFAGSGMGRDLGPQFHVGGETYKAVDRAEKFLRSQFAAGPDLARPLTTVYFHVGSRAYCDSREAAGQRFALVNLRRDSETPDVVAHELGHAIEHQYPHIGQLSRDFLAHRVGDETPRPMNVLGKSNMFGAGELGREDDFRKAFGDSAGYVGKVYEHDATEILSMGFQQYYNDPAHLARNDPEYFQFVHGILSGAIR